MSVVFSESSLRRLGCSLLALFCLFAGAAMAQDRASLKIAMLDPTRAIVETNEAQEAIKEIDEELKLERETLNTLQDEIAQLQDRLRKDEDIMSDEEKRRAQREIQVKDARARNTLQLMQSVRGQRLEELINAFGPRLEAVIDDLVSLEGYDLVLTLHRPQTTLYVNPKHDITRRVTEELNEN